MKISKHWFKRFPETVLKLNYAIARFVKSEIAFKTREEDPRAYLSFKLLTDREEVALHLRIPTTDQWNGIQEFLDVDLYFPAEEIAKIIDLTEGCVIKKKEEKKRNEFHTEEQTATRRQGRTGA